MEDSDGRIWIGTYGSGVAVHSTAGDVGASLEFALQDSNETTIIVSALLEGTKQNVWVGTSGDGLYLIEVNTGATTHFGKNASTPSPFDAEYILSLHLDMDGNLWIATGDRGLFRMNTATACSIMTKRGSIPGSTGETLNTRWNQAITNLKSRPASVVDVGTEARHCPS